MAYHITEDGPRPCSASKRACPRGGKHFGDRQQAQRYYEEQMEAAAQGKLPRSLERSSKALSKALRHMPSMVGEEFGENGTLTVKGVLRALRLSKGELDTIVALDSKGRYRYEAGETLIRAVQGHSAPVRLRLAAKEPPAQLYHGTVAKYLSSIFSQGLKPMQRHHVHLSPGVDAAEQVGARRGEPVLLLVDAAAMVKDGCTFYQADNGVWLTDAVPPKYLRVL